MFTKAWIKVNGIYARYVKNERGAQALEWVALGLVVLAVMSAIAMGIKEDSTLGQAIMTKIGDLIKKIGTGGEGG